MKKFYLEWTLLSLLILLGLTFVFAYVDLRGFNFSVALFFAFFKASLVGLFFMKLAWSPRIQHLAAAMGILWITILFLLSFSDYISRSWLYLPSPWPQ
jgi:cytochrome c oxidase subunit 4